MKKIIILGASILQLPAIKKAKEMGFDVIVIDYNPDAIGIKYADKHYTTSTNNIDGVLQIARTEKPDGIMTLATDMPMRTIAVVANELKLPGISIDTAIKATDKGAMIKAFKGNGVDSPWFYLINEEKELTDKINDISYPCILKPTNSSGSRGVIFVNKEEDLIKSFYYSKKFSGINSVIVEEYLEGKEVSVEVIVVKGTVHILAITDKITSSIPYFVEMGHSQPSQHDNTDLNLIKDLATRAVKSIGLENGPAHVEIMVTVNGPKMIELGARLGGDFITTHLVPLSTGIDMVRATINLSVGTEPDLIPKFNKGSAIKYFQFNPGILKSITGLDKAKNISGVKEIIFTKEIGETLETITSSSNRIGHIISQGSTASEALEICNTAAKQVIITTKEY